MMNDGDKLHPTLRGYQVWADGLKPILAALLGPPTPTARPAADRRPERATTVAKERLR
jgi:hypothetical protein